MRTFLALVLVASVASAQDRRLPEEGSEFLLRVRSVDTTKQASMTIGYAGRIFGSLGAVKGTYGMVQLGPDSGTGEGTVVGSLLPNPGRLTFQSVSAGPELELTIARVADASTPVLRARGRFVAVSYSSEGELSVTSKP